MSQRERFKGCSWSGSQGTGKTTLSRKIAYRWTQDKWGQELKAVYVLPVRALQESQYDNGHMRKEATLPTAIANNCFAIPPSEEDEYKRLRCQISKELKQAHDAGGARWAG